MATAMGQTIMVVNKSGKVVKTSKHIVNVFKEAKSAYLERKAELKTQRDIDNDKKGPRKSPAAAKLDRDGHSRASSVSSRHSHSSRRHGDESPRSGDDHHRRHGGSRDDSHRRHGSESRDGRRHSASPRSRPNKPPVERGYSDSFYVNDRAVPRRSPAQPPSPLRFMEDAEHHGDGKEMVLRRHSYDDAQSSTHSRRDRDMRGTETIDMDLAYGELPPPLPSRTLNEENELRSKVTGLQRMLEEANCVQHSAKAMIAHLENNPDAMAAVALTLAEISNLVSKLGPGALAMLKTSFPAVIALLISPEFLIAAGVGVGITVVMFGGYKIIKKIKEKKALEKETQEEVVEEVTDDISHIESWRRGIAEAEASSIGTSVEGEYITPGAAAQLREQKAWPPSEKQRKKAEEAARRKQEKKMKEKTLSATAARKEREKQEKKEKKEADKAAAKAAAQGDSTAKEGPSLFDKVPKDSAGFRKLFQKDNADKTLEKTMFI